MRIIKKAHGKINLTLDVLNRRPDGYHEVEMIMQSIALHDVLEFTSTGPAVTLAAQGGEVPLGEDNLIIKAARLLQQHTGCRQGAAINLQKNIPVAAGLAGGSTDAAATLTGLNELWGLKLNKDELKGLGRRLGADVPFCLLGGTALARGIGEKLTALPPASTLGLILVKPPFGVSTAAVYQNFRPDRVIQRPDHQRMVENLAAGNVPGIGAGVCNVLESVTIGMHPEIGTIKKQLLEAGCCGVLMSGSGPTVFGITFRQADAEKIFLKLNFPGMQVIVSRTV